MTSSNTNIDKWVQWIEDGISKNYINYYEYSGFQNIQYIASGAFGDVYKANWNSNNVIALKSFRNNNFIMKEIVNESQLLRQVHFHENIIKLIGITKRKNSGDIIDPVYLLILEYADSGTLRNYLKENFSKLDWNIKLKFGIQIAGAVSYLHQNDIIHRDLHSNNILVHQDIVKLVDFGLSRRLAEVSTNKNIFGMIPYIDPQHFKKQVDKNYYKPNKKSDVYSVGMLLWEISSGRKPFESYFEYQQLMLMLEILNGKREDPISDTPNDYINVYEKCWKNNPDDRPDMQQVVSELGSINLENKNNIKLLSTSSRNTVNTANDLPYVDSSLEGCKITNNDEIINELLSLIYQKDYDIQLIKQCIILKSKSENEIFNYLLNNKDNQQNIILLAEFYKYGIGTDKNVVKAFELICKETGHVECENETIDNFIQKMQLKTDDKLFEWIPCNQFDDIKEIGEAIYLAVWENGPLHYDNKMKEVTLNKITNEFLHKCSNNLKIYGISQNPDTKDYVMVLDDNCCEKCGEQYTDTNKWCKLCQIGYLKNNFTNQTSGNEKIDDLIQEMQLKINNYDDIIFEWIPYNQFNNIEKIEICVFYTEYSAIWKDGPLCYDKNKRELKRKSDKKIILRCLQNITNRFLNRIKEYSINKCGNILKIYGISQEPETNNYILILEYMKGGNLEEWISKNDSWLNKLSALINIIIGLEEIHEKKMIHCFFQPGDILLEGMVIDEYNGLYITGMESCRKVDEDIDNNYNNYGVMPYVAPEMIREKGSYTQAIDIYNFGLIMYLVATGKKPFADYDNRFILSIYICNGTRPEIREPEAPRCYIDLMKRCWDSDPDKRPNVTEVKKLIELFYESYCGKRGNKEIEEQFDKAEKYRSFIYNIRSTHSNTVYTPEDQDPINYG